MGPDSGMTVSLDTRLHRRTLAPSIGSHTRAEHIHLLQTFGLIFKPEDGCLRRVEVGGGGQAPDGLSDFLN